MRTPLEEWAENYIRDGSDAEVLPDAVMEYVGRLERENARWRAFADQLQSSDHWIGGGWFWSEDDFKRLVNRLLANAGARP